MTEIPSNSVENIELIEAERCIAELQRGRAIVLTDESKPSPVYQRIQLAETLCESDLERLISSHSCQLVISRSRALALDLIVDSDAVCLELDPHIEAKTIFAWAGLYPCANDIDKAQLITRVGGHGVCTGTEPPTVRNQHSTQAIFAKAALNLAHHAHALPAFIVHELDSIPAPLLQVNADIAWKYQDRSNELIMLSQARVPLATSENVMLTVFRERHGNAEHIAITVGEPNLSDIVTVRLHSSCFTGDVLGSMKCDCGEQLQRAIVDMSEGDGGVVLYISQEGRGIGLASKLLAYQLQDKGLDTIDANLHLGFESDARQYSSAVYMLEKLGIHTVRLMTNNPLKIQALRQHGINVDSRIASPATVNAHNARYLETKRNRAGHLVCCEHTG